MSWKPEVLVQGIWSKNGLVFATETEARENAADLAYRWTLCEDSRAIPSEETPNYTYDRETGLKAIEAA